MNIIGDYIKLDLPGSVKLGSGCVLYIDDISEQARIVLDKNNAKFNTNKAGQLLVELPKDTCIVSAIRSSDGSHSNGATASLYILPDNTILETVVMLSRNGPGKVLLGIT